MGKNRVIITKSGDIVFLDSCDKVTSSIHFSETVGNPTTLQYNARGELTNYAVCSKDGKSHTFYDKDGRETGKIIIEKDSVYTE